MWEEGEEEKRKGRKVCVEVRGRGEGGERSEVRER